MTECQYSQLKPLALMSLIGIFILQLYLFSSYIQREVVGDLVLHGDPNWFVFFSYEIFNHLINHDWAWLFEKARSMPWGILFWLESAGLQLLLGPGRLSILFINLLYYIACQIAVFFFFFWFGKERFYGWLGLLLFLTLATPFTAVALNIRDFHPDLITAFLYIGFFLLLGRSDCFYNKRLSVIIGLFAAYTSYMRLVSAFSLVGMFGLFFLIILVFTFFDTKNRNTHKNRLINTVIATMVFLALVVPHLAFSLNALKYHYFRFIFDKDFANIAIPLYNFGRDSAISGVMWIFGRMIWHDFGKSSLLAFGMVGALIIIIKIVSEKAVKDAEKKAHSVGIFYIFLAVAAAYSCYQHAVFPIKSAHLTRLTMTPLFVLVACWMINSIRTLTDKGQWKKWILLPIVALLSLQVQLNFYAGKDRLHDFKMDLLSVGSMYEDIFSYCQKNGMNELGISTDFSTDEFGYALGAFMGFYSYVWEKYGLLIKPRSQMMGSAHDAPFDLEKAYDFLDRSDAVVLSSDPYPENGKWPLNESVRAIRPELVAKVKDEFILYSTYKLFGKEKSLYFKQWKISASSSINAFYGPSLLLTEPRIWHAPWDGGKTPQWVMFTAPKPKSLSSISITAQDGCADRAPKSFSFQTLDENGNWISLLDVENANFSTDNMKKSWTLKMKKEYRQFRLWITQNNGHPALLTIKRMNLIYG